MALMKIMKANHGMTRNMLFCFGLMTVSIFSYGFDNQVYSAIQALDPFEKRFGDGWDPKVKEWTFTAKHLAMLNSLGLPAKGVGTVVGWLIGEHFGRRWAFILMQFVALFGIAISYTAKTYGQIVSGRVIVQFFVGWEDWLCPMFWAEIAPAGIRGSMVVFYAFAHFFGSFISGFVTYGSSKVEGDMAWKIPIAVMFAFPCIALLGSYWLPESPRWLVRRNRRDKAVESLHFLMGRREGYDAEREATLLQAALLEDAEAKGNWSEVFNKTNRKRSGIALTAGIFNQLTGQSFASQYGVIFVKSLQSLDPFVYVIISRSIGLVGPIFTFFAIEKIGRRRLYFTMGLLCFAALYTMGGLGIGMPGPGAIKGIIAMVILFGSFYSAGFGSIGAVISAETPHLRLRDKVSVLVYVTHIVCDFLVTFTLPYLLDDEYAGLGSKVGFIYGSFALLGVIWAFYLMPEMKGRSLEELEEMWQERVPPRKFRTWQSSNPQSIGHLVTEAEIHPEQTKAIDIQLEDAAIEGSKAPRIEQVERV